MNKPEIPTRADYRVFYPVTTRWMDNDIYGHVNNVTYYSYFDTVANRYLIEEGGLDISDGSIVGWGHSDYMDYGQEIPPPGNDFIAIDAGNNISLALKSDGSIVGSCGLKLSSVRVLRKSTRRSSSAADGIPLSSQPLNQ